MARTEAFISWLPDPWPIDDEDQEVCCGGEEEEGSSLLDLVQDDHTPASASQQDLLQETSCKMTSFLDLMQDLLQESASARAKSRSGGDARGPPAWERLAEVRHGSGVCRPPARERIGEERHG